MAADSIPTIEATRVVKIQKPYLIINLFACGKTSFLKIRKIVSNYYLATKRHGRSI
jgi:hypothetical protein